MLVIITGWGHHLLRMSWLTVSWGWFVSIILYVPNIANLQALSFNHNIYIYIYTYIIIPIYIYNYIIYTYIICTYRMYKMSLLWSWKLSRWLFPRFTVLQCSSGWPKWRWIFQRTSWLLLGCGSVAVGRLRGLLVICPDISKTIQGGGPPSHKLVYKPQ